ncbi:MAG: hypothetical protein Q8P39_02335 [Candidatus Yanofskybacteria bacterium]|nr:hypothetical protein [Candidatus Yanofskybacteria bacterium]
MHYSRIIENPKEGKDILEDIQAIALSAMFLPEKEKKRIREQILRSVLEYPGKESS